MYRTEDIETYLPAVWDANLWVNPPQREHARCTDPNGYRHTHTTLPCETFHSRCTNPKWCVRRTRKAADANMRKASIDPKKSNTAWAELIDVTQAWKSTPLTQEESSALFLRYGAFWTQAEIGFNQGVCRQTAGRRIASGLEKLAAFLNGDADE